jgi:hypothetical protein
VTEIERNLFGAIKVPGALKVTVSAGIMYPGDLFFPLAPKGIFSYTILKNIYQSR